MSTRIGFGCDTHQAVSCGAHGSVMICGVKVDANYSVVAHSDGDVGLHALVDAMLGACAMGDIGEHFPPSDHKWKDKDSRVFVAYALDLVQKRDGVIINVDITVVSQYIRLGALKMNMRIAVAEMLGITIDNVSIKAKTAEHMGALGRGEGIAAYAVVSIEMD